MIWSGRISGERAQRNIKGELMNVPTRLLFLVALAQTLITRKKRIGKCIRKPAASSSARTSRSGSSHSCTGARTRTRVFVGLGRRSKRVYAFSLDGLE